MVVFDHSLGWFILVYLSLLKTNLHILTLCFSGLLDFTLSLYCRGTVLPFLQNYFTNLKSGRQSKDTRSLKKSTVFCSKGASRSKKNALFYIRCKLSLLPSAGILQPTTLVWVQRKGWNLLSLGVNKQKVSKEHCISKVYVGGDDGVAWIGFKFFSFPWFAVRH